MADDNDIPTAPAGWYSSPGRPHLVQWFDGSEWQDRFQAKPAAGRSRIRTLVTSVAALALLGGIALTLLLLRPSL